MALEAAAARWIAWKEARAQAPQLLQSTGRMQPSPNGDDSAAKAAYLQATTAAEERTAAQRFSTAAALAETVAAKAARAFAQTDGVTTAAEIALALAPQGIASLASVLHSASAARAAASAAFFRPVLGAACRALAGAKSAQAVCDTCRTVVACRAALIRAVSAAIPIADDDDEERFGSEEIAETVGAAFTATPDLCDTLRHALVDDVAAAVSAESELYQRSGTLATVESSTLQLQPLLGKPPRMLASSVAVLCAKMLWLLPVLQLLPRREFEPSQQLRALAAVQLGRFRSRLAQMAEDVPQRSGFELICAAIGGASLLEGAAAELELEAPKFAQLASDLSLRLVDIVVEEVHGTVFPALMQVGWALQRPAPHGRAICHAVQFLAFFLQGLLPKIDGFLPPGAAKELAIFRIATKISDTLLLFVGNVHTSEERASTFTVRSFSQKAFLVQFNSFKPSQRDVVTAVAVLKSIGLFFVDEHRRAFFNRRLAVLLSLAVLRSCDAKLATEVHPDSAMSPEKLLGFVQNTLRPSLLVSDNGDPLELLKAVNNLVPAGSSVLDPSGEAAKAAGSFLAENEHALFVLALSLRPACASQ